MSPAKLTQDERELLDSFEQDEWEPVDNLELEKKRYQSYAQAAFRKDARINIRISTQDLLALQKRALEEGIPYQTLIASVLHKYLSGRLTDRSG
jgi:predicted DNA binding CopG/RHH family protein